MRQKKIYNSSTYPLNSFTISPKTNKDLSEKIHNLVPIFADYSKKDLAILPKNFEPQNHEWKKLLVDAVDQGECGSCWSFASVALLTDRINILAKEKLLNQSLSNLINIVCNDLSDILNIKNVSELNSLYNPYKNANQLGCYGNSIILSMYYLKIFGVCKSKCVPYNIKNQAQYKIKKTNFGFIPSRSFENSPTHFSVLDDESNKIASCFFLNPFSTKPFDYCSDIIKAKSNQYYTTPFQTFQILFPYFIKDCLINENYIKYDIYKWGPVCSSFLIYNDFYTFDPVKDGVYIHNDKDQNIIGGHSVEIVGWGEWKDKNGKFIPFWWIKNSWGKEYGYNGYFRFLRGKNHCEIENNVISAIPYLFFDIKEINQYKSYNDKLKSLNIFYFEYKKLDYTFDFISRSLPFIIPLSKKKELLQKSYELYGFFGYNALLYVSLFNNDFYHNGYSYTEYKILPGLDLSFTRKSGQPIEFPFNDQFLAGKMTQEKYSGSSKKSFLSTFLFIFLIIVCIIIIFLFLFLFITNKI